MIQGIRRLAFLFLIVVNGLQAQNVQLYLTMLEKGQIQEVQTNLPELLSRYPETPGIYYIQALVTQDGDSSLTLFRQFLERFPDSEYAGPAAMKIGEYLFARGLYSQASLQFRKVLMSFPANIPHQRVMDLMVNSYIAIGEEDTVVQVLKTLKQIYPSLNYEQYGFAGLEVQQRDAKLVKLDQKQAARRIKSTRTVLRKPPIQNPKIRPWVVQVGAFSKYTNAKRLKQRLEEKGYKVTIDEVHSNGRRLHVVRVLRYGSKQQAQQIGEELKARMGLDFRVINKPEL
ncbi:MAG: SPOR domain-containing protein [Fidelibacterota bacterium]